MKIRTTRFIFKEGLLNAYKNRLMSFASMSIVVASLIIFGIFFIITVTFNHNLNVLKEQPEIQVFCHTELDDAQVADVEDAIKQNEKIDEYKIVTKTEAFDKVKKEMFSGAEGVLEDLDESIMPVSFIIKLKDSRDSEEIVQQFKSMVEVENVNYSKQAIDIITKITYWVPLVCSFILIILLVVAVFIISNTIKLTVFARRREINIMKYIGATDWFIRWPFIIEGVIIGITGAAVAFAIIGFAYGMLESRASTWLAEVGLMVSLVKFGEIASRLFVIYSLTGGAVGALGSFISIRKYLKV